MKKIDENKEERIQNLISLCKEYDVNGYKMQVLSKKKITQPTFNNFMNRTVATNDSTLDLIEAIVMQHFVYKNSKNILVKEDRAEYNSKNEIQEKLDSIITKLEKMELKQDIMYEIIKNGVMSSAEVVIKQHTP